MRLLVTGATKTLQKLAPTCSDVLGCMPTPAAKNDPQKIQSLGLPIAADNGCFNGLDSDAFVRMLNAYRDAQVRLDWVAVPDVVANDVETYRLWLHWSPVVKAFGFRPALVLQDGMDLMSVLDFNPPALFIGGTTEYKLGEKVRSIVRWARKAKKPVHMGRVNTLARIAYAISIGCTSCDGSGFSKWPDTRIPHAVRWIRRAMYLNRQPSLFPRGAGVPHPEPLEVV